MTIKQTIHNIKTDYLAHSGLMNIKPGFGTVLILSPSIMMMTIYWVLKWLYQNRVRPVVWLLWRFNIYLSGTDIVSTAEIGENFFLGYSNGPVMSGKIGSHGIILCLAAKGNLSKIISGTNAPVGWTMETWR
jgi:serine acetyltransferase